MSGQSIKKIENRESGMTHSLFSAFLALPDAYIV